MRRSSTVAYSLALATIAAAATAVSVSTQGAAKPFNDLPNPYQTISDWAKLPAGRTWGSTSAVDIDKDGTSVWVAERCGTNSCAGSDLPTVLKFDATGKLVTSFGAGMMIFPHGIHVDRDGNVWVTDGRAANAEELKKFPNAAGKGHAIYKFRPDGTLLMTLGKPGVAGVGPDTFNEPNDVITAPNGDIFVGDGHSGQNANAGPGTNARIVKLNKDGRFIKQWGKWGTGPGEFRTPHSLAFDAKGRLFVADRGNVRIQVFDQDGAFLGETKNFSRLSGIFIDKETLYGADSESSATSNPGWRRGMRMGPVKANIAEMVPVSFIPDPDLKASGTSAAEGVAVDSSGNIYGAEVGPRALKRYVRK